ncbi:MAG: hypothetical protein RDV41_07700 [Planctomycetota bacterium]|nr:hypothetical protein [Planctomycetota bacterium]
MAATKSRKSKAGSKATEEKKKGQAESFFADMKDTLKKAKGKICCVVHDSGIADHLKKAMDSVLSVARGNVIMVRVNDETLKRLDELVEVGLFRSKSDSAAFLISEGVKAQKIVFDKISNKATEIAKLRQELRKILGLEEKEAAES